jgi:uncharacterized protein (TIGR03437 family)
VVASTLGGYRLLFNGVPAPLLYVGANQINAVVPVEIYGQDTVALQLVTPQGTTALTNLFVAPAQPAIFITDPATGYAAAVNQDGTINSRTNPAHSGSIVAIWATGTGVGQAVPLPADGAVLQTCPSCLFPQSPALIAQSSVGGAGSAAAQTFYAGVAPGDVFGAAQVNFAVPETGTPIGEPVQLQLLVGAAISPLVQIWAFQ